MFSFHVFLERQKELLLIAEETEQKQTNRISAKPALFTCQTASFGTHKGACFYLSFHHSCNLPHTHTCTHSPLQNTSHTHFEELATCACKNPLAGPLDKAHPADTRASEGSARTGLCTWEPSADRQPLGSVEKGRCFQQTDRQTALCLAPWEACVSCLSRAGNSASTHRASADSIYLLLAGV